VLVPAFGRQAFVSCLLRRIFCRSNSLYLLYLTWYLLDFFIRF
jgi:hypothetical protein